MNTKIKGVKLYLMVFCFLIFSCAFIVAGIMTFANTISEATRSVKVAAIVNGVEVYRGPLNRIKVEEIANKINLTVYDSALNFNVVKNYLEEDVTILTVRPYEN